MSKSRSQIRDKLKEWYGWLANHVPEPIKEKASRAFKATKDKIMGLYKSFKCKESEETEESFSPNESFNPVELEQAFDRAYRSYRINGRSRIDIDTLSDRVRQNLIDLISRELKDLGSARVQTNTWIRFRIEYEEGIIDSVKLPFSSQITDIFQGSDLNAPIEEMFPHTKTQIEHPALANSRLDSVRSGENYWESESSVECPLPMICTRKIYFW